MKRRNIRYETLGIVVALGMLFCGCGPSGDEWFRQAQEAAKNKDKALAVELVLKAADKGCLDAMVAAGEIYIHGNGIEPNKELGFSLIRKAAEAKHPDAMFVLGKCYEEGIATAKDADKARYWKELAFDNDSPRAMFDIYHEIDSKYRMRSIDEKAISYSSNDKRTMAKVVKVFKSLVEESHGMKYNVDESRVCCALGDIYARGIAIIQDTQTAIAYYEKAIDLGSEWAMRELGSIYCEGEICSKDYDKGVPLLQKSLKMRNGGSDYSILEQLGKAYVDQDWPSADLGKARDYFERAVFEFENQEREQEIEVKSEDDFMVAESLYWLGRILMFEDERYRDDAKGIKYLKRAAEAHSDEAQYFLAAAYCDGIGVEKDLEKAYDLSGSAQYARDKTIAAEAKKLHDTLGKQLHPLLYQ